MERFELEPKLKEEIRARVLGEGFIKLVQTVRRNGKQFKIAMRPIIIAGEKKFQAEMTDDTRVQVKNLDANAAADGLEEIIHQRGARDLHLITSTGDLHLRVTKKGRVILTRSAEMSRVAIVQPHDRVKKTPLTSFDATTFLKMCGIADGEGKIRATMRGKYNQVNEFLRVVKDTIGEARNTDNFTVVDCGCGKAYLTFALYFYLTQTLNFKNVKVIGIDRRNDVISSAKEIAENLDLADKVTFVESSLEDFSMPEETKPDLVVSLHACDTATDEALAKAVEWKTRYILCAPCCQHELQKELAEKSFRANNRAASFSGLLRQSILRERLCDLLTDSYRALILRVLGFKVNVIEFVSSDDTARNIMLRCEYAVKAGQPGPVSEYLELRDFWDVKPWLENRLAHLLGKYFERFEK